MGAHSRGHREGGEEGEEPREWRRGGSEVGAQRREGGRRAGLTQGLCVLAAGAGLETCKWRADRVTWGTASV